MTRVRSHVFTFEEWDKYPVRVCLYSHECRICKGPIVASEKYYDGGYSRRAHVDCVLNILAQEIERRR